MAVSKYEEDFTDLTATVAATLAAVQVQLAALPNAAQFSARVGKGEEREKYDMVRIANSLHRADPHKL